jgi:hypothetical protein
MIQPSDSGDSRTRRSMRDVLSIAGVLTLLFMIAVMTSDSHKLKSAGRLKSAGAGVELAHVSKATHETVERNIEGLKEHEEHPNRPIYKMTGADLKKAHRFFHISDTHVDPYFDPTQSMGVGMCHSCKFSDAAYGKDVYCPEHIPTTEGGEEHLVLEGYAFGRYKCNPPKRLLKSLLHHLKLQDDDPEFIVFTGDIAPHGYPGDRLKVRSSHACV